MEAIHTLRINFSWKLIDAISKLDRFDGSWKGIEKKEGRTLKELRSVATVRSVGASTRIEGSKMSNEEVDEFLKNLNIEKLVERDEQEVAGYFEALDLIVENYQDIPVTENAIKSLHNTLLKYSKKDEWHRGGYKQLSNNVEAKLPDDTTKIVFKTSEPGYETDKLMRALVNWYALDQETHPIVKCAIFAYEFVSIHPFQDCNGRMSRLLSTLLLLKNGYNWVQYVSLEHEIEHRKQEYYTELRRCQAQRPQEDVTPWVYYFLSVLDSNKDHLQHKLEQSGVASQLSPVQKSILAYIGNHPGCQSGEIAKSLNIASPTVKRILNELVSTSLIEKYGSGRGTNYSII